MKKTMIASALAAAMALALCACGGGAASSSAASAEAASSQAASVAASADAASAAASADAATSADAAASSASANAEVSADVAADEEYYLQLLEQNLDMSQYKQIDKGFTSDNRLSAPIDAVEIAGKTLRFGMAYDELISVLGSDITVPEGLADMETKGGGVTVMPLSSFKTADGAGFRLSFAGEEGATVKDGTLATASNTANSSPAPIAVKGITTGSSMADVVAALGSPADIMGKSSGGDNTIEFSYTYFGDEGASKATVEFDHDAVAAVSVQGPMA